jgi:hypothetical protein
MKFLIVSLMLITFSSIASADSFFASRSAVRENSLGCGKVKKAIKKKAGYRTASKGFYCYKCKRNSKNLKSQMLSSEITYVHKKDQSIVLETQKVKHQLCEVVEKKTNCYYVNRRGKIKKKRFKTSKCSDKNKSNRKYYEKSDDTELVKSALKSVKKKDCYACLSLKDKNTKIVKVQVEGRRCKSSAKVSGQYNGDVLEALGAGKVLAIAKKEKSMKLLKFCADQVPVVDCYYCNPSSKKVEKVSNIYMQLNKRKVLALKDLGKKIKGSRLNKCSEVNKRSYMKAALGKEEHKKIYEFMNKNKTKQFFKKHMSAFKKGNLVTFYDNKQKPSEICLALLPKKEDEEVTKTCFDYFGEEFKAGNISSKKHSIKESEQFKTKCNLKKGVFAIDLKASRFGCSIKENNKKNHCFIGWAVLNSNNDKVNIPWNWITANSLTKHVAATGTAGAAAPSSAMGNVNASDKGAFDFSSLSKYKIYFSDSCLDKIQKKIKSTYSARIELGDGNFYNFCKKDNLFLSLPLLQFVKDCSLVAKIGDSDKYGSLKNAKLKSSSCN